VLPSRVPVDACDWSDSWGLDPALASKLSQMQRWWSNLDTGLSGPGLLKFPPLYIISGMRSKKHNDEVGGAPASFHLRCPSLAADLRVGQVAGLDSDELWAILGGWWRLHGGRWGGTFSDPDPNHFDIGGV